LADWYRKETTEVISLLSTDAEAGLPAAEVQRRLSKHGLNELVERLTAITRTLEAVLR